MTRDDELVRSLIARALYALERGWTAAALDALGRAAQIAATDRMPLYRVTVESPTDEQRQARLSPKVRVEFWPVGRENPR